MEKKRDITIDIIKVIGILTVILAHVNLPKVIFQLRNFGLPLLMLAAGMLAVHSFEKCKNSLEYIWKRMKRLIIPTWIFLTLFFIIDLLWGQKYIHNWQTIVNSFLFDGGIGYVWIIRVYVLNALTIPLLINLKRVLNKKKYYCIILVLYIIYEIIFYKFGNKNIILENVIYYIIPYGFVCTSLGMQLKEMKKRNILMIAIVLLSIFAVLAINFYIQDGKFVQTNEYKYPPRIYYLSYALGISMLIYYIVDKIKPIYEKYIKNGGIIKFISSHTMWIYLWHILYLYIIQIVANNIGWVWKFVIIAMCSIITTYIQSKLVNKIIKNKSEIKMILDC